MTYSSATGRHAWALNSLLVNFVEAGQWKEAESIYHELLLRSKTGHVLPSLLAMASAAMGKDDEAMRYAYETYERHDPFQVQCFNVWPDNKFLSAIPEYAMFPEKFVQGTLPKMKGNLLPATRRPD